MVKTAPNYQNQPFPTFHLAFLIKALLIFQRTPFWKSLRRTKAPNLSSKGLKLVKKAVGFLVALFQLLFSLFGCGTFPFVSMEWPSKAIFWPYGSA